MVGTWMQVMAQSWLMTGLTSSAFILSTVNAASSVPMLLLTMYGGTVADRHDKRRILIASQIVQIVLAVAVGLLVMSGHVRVWHILTAAVLLGVSSSFEMPAAAAFVPELVERDEIATAVAVDRSIFHGSRLVGPALAGYCIYLFGTASAFFGNALSFLPMIGVLWTAKPRALGSEEEEQQRSSGMKAGIDYVRQDRPTLAMMMLMAASSLCIFPFMAVIMPLYARDTLGLNAKYTGWLMAASGIGSLAASVGVPLVQRAKRVSWMVAGSGAILCGLAGLAVARVFWQAAPAVVLLAIGTSFNYGLANTTVQERAPGPLRGRISALAMMSFVAVMPFASMLVGWLSDLTSVRAMMFAGTVGYGVAAAFIFSGPARGTGDLPTTQPAAVPVEA